MKCCLCGGPLFYVRGISVCPLKGCHKNLSRFSNSICAGKFTLHKRVYTRCRGMFEKFTGMCNRRPFFEYPTGHVLCLGASGQREKMWDIKIDFEVYQFDLSGIYDSANLSVLERWERTDIPIMEA